jgi:competence protein ComEC
MLEIVAVGDRVLWTLGGVGRASELVPPSLPSLMVLALAAAGWLALQSVRRARLAAAAWIGLLLAAGGWWWYRPSAPSPRVALLEVHEGLAALTTSGRSGVLFDGGRARREASELLADSGVRRLRAVIASHADEDHVGGLPRVVRTLGVDLLLLPDHMLADARSVALLRAARERGVRVRPVARGSALTLDGSRLEVLWPPARAAASTDNERSMVVRLEVDGAPGAVLLTGDIGTEVERRLVPSWALASDVLVVPHHGSRTSTSASLLDRCRPRLALIPAGPGNLHHHPSPEVLDRLRRRCIPFRAPILHGPCGAEAVDGRWRAFP